LAQIGGIAVNELQVFSPDPDACAENSVEFLGIDGRGDVYGYGHGDMYEDLVGFFDGSGSYPVDRADCLATLKLLNAFYRSDELGDWVEVDAPDQSTRLGRANEEISNLYRTRPSHE
jgi:hypothetical protein